jgi:hypothetical protein
MPVTLVTCLQLPSTAATPHYDGFSNLPGISTTATTSQVHISTKAYMTGVSGFWNAPGWRYLGSA